MQEWDLQRKIQVTQTRIIEWYQHYNGMVYVSFSGGKDSTVLLDLARRIYPDMEAAFIDTGLEYPEIRDFVKSKENVAWLHPQKYNRHTKQYERYSFNQVLEDYGYPVISKNVSQYIREIKSTNSEKLKNLRLYGEGSTKGVGVLSNKWKFLIDAPFEISDKCCSVMKKRPAHLFDKESGKHPIIATMTDESRQRKMKWLKTGCNSFEQNNPQSIPMSFWTEQDVLTYIKKFNVPYSSIYGDIIENEKGELETTGEKRTGCMFCMFGVQCEKDPNRFQRMKITHPKQYDYCMNKLELGKILDYINIKY